jgi:hypothetical protein
MNEITLRPDRPADLTRRLFLAGLVPALIAALATDRPKIDISKECHGGAFSSAFGSGFDVQRCDLVVKKIGSPVELRVRLPQ